MFSKYEKNIRIPVIFEDGQIKFYYGGAMPIIEEGTIGELVLPEYSVENKEIVKKLQDKYEVRLFDSGTILYLGMQNNFIPHNLFGSVVELKNVYPPIDCQFVEVILNEPLYLLFRGSKQAKLQNVECVIPALANKKAISINNAYTLISEVFEPERKSHSGNVFDKCYYKYIDIKSGTEHYFPIERLRQNYEAEYEKVLILDSRAFLLNPSLKSSYLLNDDEKLLIDCILEHGELSGLHIKELFKNDKNRFLKVLDSLLELEIIIGKAI